MAGKRRVFGPAFKAKVALAAAKGDRTTAQLASQFGIHTIRSRPDLRFDAVGQRPWPWVAPSSRRYGVTPSGIGRVEGKHDRLEPVLRPAAAGRRRPLRDLQLPGESNVPAST